MRSTTKILLLLGLFLAPLVGPSNQMAFSIIFSCILVASLHSTHHFTPVKNKWLTALICFLPISIIQAPHIQIQIGKAFLGGVWMWQSLAWCLGYYGMFLAISNICFKRDKFKYRIALAIAIPAVLSAGYAYLQYFNLDQFQFVRPFEQIGTPEMARITAWIGNPTYLAVYLSACLPFVFRYLGIGWAIFCLIPILFCKSDTALFGMILAVSIWFAMRRPRNDKLIIFLILALCVIVCCFMCKDKFSGRLTTWHNTIQDYLDPPVVPSEGVGKTYPITGRGIGSFAVFYPVKHKNTPDAPVWDSAHNEYLETLYSLGIIGLILLFGSLWTLIYENRKAVFDKFFGCIILSVIFLIIAAGTLPVWHHPVFQVMFVCLAAILSRFENN